MRGATACAVLNNPADDVSIHAPHAGRDLGQYLGLADALKFQSTRPMRGATTQSGKEFGPEAFQSTRPMRGATAKEVTTSLFCHIFMGITRHKYDFLDV